MLQPKTLGVVALLGLLATTVASADERRYDGRDYDRGTYWSAPQVRLGVDVIWGGNPPPRPPVIWYPAYYPTYYPTYYRAYYPAERYYGPGNGRGYGKGHGKHRHHPHRGDDWDD